MTRKAAWVSFSIALLIASGCVGDATGPAANGPDAIERGMFSAQVSGAVNTSFTGRAWFSEFQDLFHLHLLDTRVVPTAAILVARAGQGRPGVGSHTIGNEEGIVQGGLVAAIGFSTADEVFVTDSRESGTLRITASSTNRLAGTLELEAVGDESGRKVTVTASFDATCERCE